MSLIDVLIIFAFLAYCITSGIRSKEQAGKNLEEYFLAGRSLPGWKAGISMAATQFAADTPLVVTGLVATAGVFALWRLWIYALAFLLMGFVLGPSWRRAGVLTDAELTEVRYGSRAAAVLRLVKAIYFGTVFNCIVLGMVLLAATRIAEPFLTWNQWLPDAVFSPLSHLVEWIGVPVTIVPSDPSLWPADVWITSTNNLMSIFAIVTVTTFYSTTGGLRSVVDTDVVQFGIMMAATAAFTWIVVDKSGGLAGIPDKLAAIGDAGGLQGHTPMELLSFTPGGTGEVGTAFMAVLSLQWLAQMNADGTGYLAQRTMACRSDDDARRAAVIFTVTQILVRGLLWLPLCLGLLIAFPPIQGMAADLFKAEREATFVRGIHELLPAGLMGLMVTGMLAALASTVDTHLNWGASYWTNDIYKRFICQAWRKKEPDPRTLVWVARLANICLLLVSLVVMMNLGSIQDAWESSLLLGAGMGGVLVLRWLWWRVTAQGELAAIIASLILLKVLHSYVDDGAAQFLLMAGGATAAAIAVSLVTRPDDVETVHAFYRRARPPGFWGPVAEAAGDHRHAGVVRLGRSLGAVGLACFSLFCMLISIGSWLIGSPAPDWMPSRALWIGGLLALGVALVPLWWRIAFDDKLAPPDTELAPSPAEAE